MRSVFSSPSFMAGVLRAALPVALSLAAATASAQAGKQLNGEAPLVLAHRGTTGYLPEHTLGGYELAVKMGADYIEPDLQLTKDGVLVAMHDNSLARTTNVQTLFPGRPSYNVWEFTLAEIKTLTVRPAVTTAATTYPGFTPVSPDPYRVPTFQQVIDLARSQSALSGREIGIYPEAKQNDPVMEDKILQTLIANGYVGTDKVFIQSFYVDSIRSFQNKQTALGADFNLVVLSSSSNALVTYGLGNIKSFADGVGVSITGAGAGESFIDQAHAAGLLVHGYTFNRPTADLADPQYQQWFNWGIDGVFSNYTDLAVASRDLYVTSIPEPGTWAMLTLGLGALGFAARRRAAGSRRPAALPAVAAGA